MINNKKVLAIIPARGGSKGLPNKNILKLIDKPLIAWSIEQAIESKYVDSCIVSTDNKNIKEKAIEYGAKVDSLRPLNLSTDTSTTNEVVDYELKQLNENFDILLLLQPTSPLRTSKNIDEALEMMSIKKSSSVVSVVKTNHPPEWSFKLNTEHKIKDVKKLLTLKRRQDSEPSYRLNGAIYATNISNFKKDNAFIRKDTAILVMSENSSIDIDTIDDFKFAESTLRKLIFD